MTGRPISEDDLHAYVDGQLPAARQEEVAAWLEQHSAVASKIHAYGEQRERIGGAFADVLEEPVPLRLNLRAIHSAHRPAPVRQRMTALAASVCLVLAGGLGGWSLRSWSQPPQRGIGALAQEAATSYAVYAPDELRPIEVSATDRGMLDRWISRRLGHAVRAPDLGKSGFRLLGGRLVATPHGPAGLFVYQNGGGVRVAMLVREMDIDKTATMRRNRIGATDGYAWADDGIGFSMVGPTTLGDINPLADEARRQMSAPRQPI